MMAWKAVFCGSHLHVTIAAAWEHGAPLGQGERPMVMEELPLSLFAAGLIPRQAKTGHAD